MLTQFTIPRFGDLAFGVPAMGELRREIDRLFHDYDGSDDALGDRLAGNGPRASLSDEGDHLALRAEVPGFEEKDLDVSLERGVLTLRGARTPTTPEGFEERLRERRGVKFASTFALPARVDADRASATLRDGVLTLTLPKSADERPTKVTVRAG